MNMNISLFQETGLELELDYTPSRPAPHCCNHDSNKYDDEGDAESFEITKAFLNFKTETETFALPLRSWEISILSNKLRADILKWCRIEYAEIQADQKIAAKEA